MSLWASLPSRLFMYATRLAAVGNRSLLTSSFSVMAMRKRRRSAREPSNLSGSGIRSERWADAVDRVTGVGGVPIASTTGALAIGSGTVRGVREATVGSAAVWAL